MVYFAQEMNGSPSVVVVAVVYHAILRVMKSEAATYLLVNWFTYFLGS